MRQGSDELVSKRSIVLVLVSCHMHIAEIEQIASVCMHALGEARAVLCSSSVIEWSSCVYYKSPKITRHLGSAKVGCLRAAKVQALITWLNDMSFVMVPNPLWTV